MNKAKKLLTFLTHTVFIYSIIGIILIIVGQSAILSQIIINLPINSPIHSIIKLIGGTLLGSGVFTAIIKSSEYTEVFTRIVEKIVGSKEFIAKRTDKLDFWRTVSHLLYKEKFPAISEELQNIIANHYLPTTSEFYLEDYNVFINITEVNNEFWKHHETLKFKIRPSTIKSKIEYSIKSHLYRSSQATDDNPDITEYSIDEFHINGVEQTSSLPEPIKNEKVITNEIKFDLQNNEEYDIVIKQTKVLCKKSNPEKRFFARYIINKLSVTLLFQNNNGTDVELYKLGTVTDFVNTEDQTNQNTRIKAWSNNGLILPHQGYILIFK